MSAITTGAANPSYNPEDAALQDIDKLKEELKKIFKNLEVWEPTGMVWDEIAKEGRDNPPALKIIPKSVQKALLKILRTTKLPSEFLLGNFGRNPTRCEYSAETVSYVLFVTEYLDVSPRDIIRILEEPLNGSLKSFVYPNGHPLQKDVLYKAFKWIDKEGLRGQWQWFVEQTRKRVHRWLCLKYAKVVLQLRRHTKNGRLQRVEYSIFWLLNLIDWAKYAHPQVPRHGTHIGRRTKGQMAFLRAFMWMVLTAKSIHKLAEKLRTYEEEDTGAAFWLASKLGFIGLPPSLTTIYRAWKKVGVARIQAISLDLIDGLRRLNVIELKAIAIDASALRAHKNDADARDGESSKGGFHGYKLHLLVEGQNGVPLFGVVTRGQVSDGKVLIPLFQCILELRADWLEQLEHVLADAGYDWTRNYDFIRQILGALPFIDLNPGNSHILKEIKSLTDKLRKVAHILLWTPTRRPSRKEPARHKRIRAYRRAQVLGRKIDNLLQELMVKPDTTEYERAYSVIARSSIAWIRVYYKRTLVEGILGIAKKDYRLLGMGQSVVPFKGLRSVELHSVFVLTAIQLVALGNTLLSATPSLLAKNFH